MLVERLRPIKSFMVSKHDYEFGCTIGYIEDFADIAYRKACNEKSDIVCQILKSRNLPQHLPLQMLVQIINMSLHVDENFVKFLNK